MSESKASYGSLPELLKAASEASPATRIDYRDSIAEYGADGVAGVEPWLLDPRMGAFAVRVAERAAAFGANAEATRALRQASTDGYPDMVRRDAMEALGRLGIRTPAGVKRPRVSKRDRPVASPDSLVVNKVYRRRDLHEQGLGGNWQSGISYPENGHYVLLFSDPDRGRDYGYHDRWVGDEYYFYGQWTGEGDMVYEVGNRQVVDRSNDLHLFIKGPAGHRYEGRVAFIDTLTERTTREGRALTAIVFRLKPIAVGT